MPKPKTKPQLMYVRVKDVSTGHEYDLREDSPLLKDEKAVRPVKAKEYPRSRTPRRPKYHTDLAGRPVSRETDAAAAESEPPAAPAVADEATEQEK